MSLGICLIPNDPAYPVYKLSGQLPHGIAVCVEERRLLQLAEIAESILEPGPEQKPGSGLRRTDSVGSFVSASSSIETVRHAIV